MRKVSDKLDYTENTNTQETPEVSVVIPTLDEEEHIGACLDSVFEVFRDGPSFEVILVDSNSCDRTVDIALEYPITVIKIVDDGLTTPGAGRYVGTKAASGGQILFVDADMILTDGWVKRAYEIINKDENICAVGGFLDETNATTAMSVNAINGVMLFDSKVLEEVGTFDPFLLGYEDVSLGFKIKAAGYDLLKLPTVVATNSRPYEVAQLKRRWQNGYLFGLGQVAQKYITTPKILKMLAYRNLSLILLQALLVFGFVTFLVSRVLFVGWLVTAFGLFLVDAFWKGPSYAAERWIRSVFAGIGFCRGFAMETPDPSEFPLECVDTLAEGEFFKSGQWDHPEESRPRVGSNR